MTTKNVYVHLDTTSNSILARGITLTDFALSVPETPHNILLLDPNAEIGEFEPHTGLKIVRLQDAAASYLRGSHASTSLSKWIDFKDVSLLQQLTPMEIAELLYFSHVGRQLHSPFFYKLQNNFVFFEQKEGHTKVYYRHLDNFYHVLAGKLARSLEFVLNRRQSFFRPKVQVAALPASLVAQLKAAFQEGVLLAFSDLKVAEQEISIPIFIVEDRLRQVEATCFSNENQIASLVYSLASGKWYLVQEDWELLPNLKQV